MRRGAQWGTVSLHRPIRGPHLPGSQFPCLSHAGKFYILVITIFTSIICLYYCADVEVVFQVAEMVVADGGGEIKERREIVGTIKGCIKTVTCGTKLSRNDNFKALPVYTKLAYILGLRVSASHRY